MANNTAIEWTDATWNPVTGCTKVSPGCENCYMFRDYPRLKAMGVRGYGLGAGQVFLNEEVLQKPLGWTKPRMIFTCSMGDLFHSAVPWDFILRVFAVMARTPHHTYQILTKRPGRMAYFAEEILPADYRNNHPLWWWDWPPNVWAGTSVESGKYLPRLDVLARVPAKVRFVSVEPMLGPVDLQEWLCNGDCGMPWQECTGINWVIAGGESGSKARPAHPDWFRQIRDHCQAAGVPYFFKQFGEYRPAIGATLGPRFKLLGLDANGKIVGGDTPVEDVSAFVVRTGKKAAGAVLDGREWREMPSPLVTA